MDVHAIVNRLRDLSKDPQNRAAIAKDEASLSGTNHASKITTSFPTIPTIKFVVLTVSNLSVEFIARDSLKHVLL